MQENLLALAKGGSASRATDVHRQDTTDRTGSAAEARIRVDVLLLDRLMTQVGELVLARNRIVRLADEDRSGALAFAAQRLAAVTSELQEGVMKARMQPVGQLWSRFPRVVRDLAVACGKPVSLALEGETTELDRSVLEAIADPLVHMLRNALDHGIEPASERTARGKPAEGRILLRAFHEGGQVVLEVSDDGRGMDPSRLRRRAAETGILSPDQAARLDDRESLELIFLPGFSTADKVTTLSGRGVGMDVVRSNLQSIGGSVEIHTRPGQGTLFRLKIPLTLAIIPALLLTAGGQRFAIPQISLLELVRVEASETAFETLHSVTVFRLREQLLPLVSLNELLGLQEPGGRPSGPATIVVLHTADALFGLVVDSVQDTAEIVVKPLGRHLRDLRVYAGATVLGDGGVALILDIPGVAQQAHVASAETRRADALSRPAEAAAGPRIRQELVLLRSREGGRLALPLDRVARLEEFPRSAVERVGGRDVIQYRDEILPLIDLSAALPERRRGSRPPADGQETAPTENLQVVVVTAESRRVGLVVDRVLDIVEESLDGLRPSTRPGVRGCAVLRGRVTEILDVDVALAQAKALETGAAR
jgi:two-component system chemotaxis sensor kinase CheA